MLQTLRERAQGIVTWFVVLAIAAAFVFFGLNDYFPFGNSQGLAARVGGEKISWAAVDKYYEKVAQQQGSEVDAKTLKNQILMAMIKRAAWLKSANALGFRVGDEQIVALLVQIPAFQVDGKFSKEQYLKMLADASYTDASFRQELSQDILLGQLEQGLVQSNFIMPSELKSVIALLDQKRDFGYMLIPVRKYQEEIKIPAEKIQSYYENHKTNFIKPEQVSLEYVELSFQNLVTHIKPLKDEILAYFEEHKTLYALPERVHARHILVSVPQTADATLEKQAKDKIEQALVKLKNGEDFTKLAKAISDDPGSAEKGGDVGWFMHGQMVPEFEKVAFELKPGAVSEPVRTQFGYHVIQLIEHKNAEQRSFAEVKNLVEEQLKREKAEALFAERSELLAKLAFEENNSFASIIEQLGLEKKETEPFNREGGQGIANNPEVLQVAFSEELLQQGRNSAPIKLSETVTAVVRVKKHYPAEQQTLPQVEKQIQQQLAFEQAKIQIKEIGDKAALEIRNGSSPAQVAEQRKLEWIVKSDVLRMANGIDRQITMAAFQMPDIESDTQKNVKGFALPNGNYLVLMLSKVKLGNIAKLDAETQRNYRQSLTDVSSQLEYALYANQALRDAKIEVLKEPS